MQKWRFRFLLNLHFYVTNFYSSKVGSKQSFAHLPNLMSLSENDVYIKRSCSENFEEEMPQNRKILIQFWTYESIFFYLLGMFISNVPFFYTNKTALVHGGGEPIAG